jgi:hypothetical protein
MVVRQQIKYRKRFLLKHKNYFNPKNVRDRERYYTKHPEAKHMITTAPD